MVRSPRSRNIFWWFLFHVSSFDMKLRFLGSNWYISDCSLSYPGFTILDFRNPKISVKLPDFEGKIPPKTHSNHQKMNVFAVSRFRKRFPTILGVFPDSLAPEKHGWKSKIEFPCKSWHRKWARPLNTSKFFLLLVPAAGGFFLRFYAPVGRFPYRK